MKSKNTLLIIIGVIAIMTTSIIANAGNFQPNPRGNGIFSSYLQNIPPQSLNEAEKEGLLYMAEEEKLARDVYETLGNIWRIKIFNNIARAEQKHMSAISFLLNRYGLNNDTAINKIGEFKNKELQSLYNTLVAKGSKSLIDALQVGLTIEELDIKDLQEYLKKTDNKDIRFVYNNLLKGSKNHLRAFYRRLQRVGGTYTPEYLNPQEFLQIINSPMQKRILFN